MKILFDYNGTLGEAKTRLEAAVSLDKDLICPCCGQHAKIYRRKLNSGMARSLIAMWRLAKTEFLHLPTRLDARSREEGKLRHWGLVEEGPRKSLADGRGRGGWWRLTSLGADFAQGLVQLPSHIYLYQNILIALDERTPTSIQAALGRKFNYMELMHGKSQPMIEDGTG